MTPWVMPAAFVVPPSEGGGAMGVQPTPTTQAPATEASEATEAPATQATEAPATQATEAPATQATQPPTSPTVAPAVAPVTEGGASSGGSGGVTPPDSCKEGEYMKHSKCTKYYWCVHATPLEMTCPDGLYFDFAKSFCNRPEDVSDTAHCSTRSVSNSDLVRGQFSPAYSTDPNYNRVQNRSPAVRVYSADPAQEYLKQQQQQYLAELTATERLFRQF